MRLISLAREWVAIHTFPCDVAPQIHTRGRERHARAGADDRSWLLPTVQCRQEFDILRRSWLRAPDRDRAW